MDYEKIIRTLIDPIVEEPKSILVRVSEDENGKYCRIMFMYRGGTRKISEKHC